MKNLLDQFKKQVGELLISFGEQISGELSDTNKRVDKLEKEIESIKEQFSNNKEVVKEVKKSTTSKVKVPTDKDDINLLKKFTCKVKHRKSNFNMAIAEAGEIKTTDFENTVIIKNDKYNNNEIYDLTGSILLKSNNDIEDFKQPLYNTDNSGIEINLNNDIMNCIFKALDYSDKSGINKALQGVYLECIENKLNIVASDSYRLYKNEFEFNSDYFNVLLPFELLNGIKQDYNKFNNGSLKIELYNKNSINNNFIKVSYSNRVTYSQITDLPFPNFKELLKSITYNEYIDFSKVDINEYMEYSKLNTNNKYACYFNFDIYQIRTENNKFEINTSGSYVGKIGLNSKFLNDMLKIDKKVYMKNSSSMCYAKNGNEISLLMPIAFMD